MPAQSARSLSSRAASPAPRTHSLGPLVRPGSTWLWRRWTRVGDGRRRRTPVSCSSPPERLPFSKISRRAHVRARPGGRHPEGPVQENQPRDQGWAWPAWGLTWSLGMRAKSSLPRGERVAPGTPERARFYRHNCLHAQDQDFTKPPAAPAQDHIHSSLPQGPFRPGSHRDHGDEAPTTGANTKACTAWASYQLKMQRRF